MNERIRELAEQAGFVLFSSEEDTGEPIDWSCDYTEELKKFAELIRADEREKREWVGLTDEELDEAMKYWSDDSRSTYGGARIADGEYVNMRDTWRYIEAKLKEKNGG